ncbi:hypothetical protein [Kribbella sp. CA-294648]|uniref:hypothetical protein n=1 Tax=Kribbella sp. CA-294648 TaxID=3239948 RepID=UPI003D8EA7B5
MAAQSRGSVKVLPQPANDSFGDRDGVLLLAFGEDLEQQFGATADRPRRTRRPSVQLQVAEFVDHQQLDPP